MTNVTIAIDAMGGDFGPSVTIPAAFRVLRRNQHVHLILVGKESVLKKQLAKYGRGGASDRLSIQHASEEVAMSDLPSQALRSKKDSSMRVAINLVKSGEAQACVSAGNTGALMAIGRFVLKMLPGVDRPAIVSRFPTRDPKQNTRVLDLGANIDSCADHLYQFAVMGSIVAQAVDGIAQPRVALMNIGVEEIKGNDQIKRTAQMLNETPQINFIGYVEGNDIFTGVADVIVCDGFVGNVALKTMEGAANIIKYFIKSAYTKNIFTRTLAALSMPVLNAIDSNVDPGRRNGASLLGVQGSVIKSHGGADAAAYAYAIEEAIMEVRNEVPQRIHTQVSAMLGEGET